MAYHRRSVPLEEGLVIAVRGGVLELTASLRHPDEDPEPLAVAVDERLREHRYLAMTDAQLVDSEDVRVASVIGCREPIPEPVQSKLLELGLTPETTESGGRKGGWLGRALGRRPVRLDRWRLDYARAADLRPELAAFESLCAEAAEEHDPLSPEMASLVVRAAATSFGVDLAANAAGVNVLEQALDLKPQPRLVMQPEAVAALAAFLTEAIRAEHPGAEVDPDGDWPLLIPRVGAPPIGTDPVFRVVEYVRVGSRAGMSTYLRSLR